MCKKLLNIFRKKKESEPSHFFYGYVSPPNYGIPTRKRGGSWQPLWPSMENIGKISSENFQYLFKKGELPERVTRIPKFEENRYYNYENYYAGSILFPSNIDKAVDKEILYFNILEVLNRLDYAYFVKSVITLDRGEPPSKESRKDPVKDIMESYYNNHIATFAIGYFFKGVYARNPGDSEILEPSEYVFNKNSLVVEFNGITHKGIEWLALELTKKLNQEMLIVKYYYKDYVTFVYKEARKLR